MVTIFTQPSSYVELLSYDYKQPSQRADPSENGERSPKQIGGFSAQATASSMYRSIAARASSERLVSDPHTQPPSLRCGCKRHYKSDFVKDTQIKTVPSAFKTEVERFFNENGHAFNHSFLSFNCNIQFKESVLADDCEL